MLLGGAGSSRRSGSLPRHLTVRSSWFEPAVDSDLSGFSGSGRESKKPTLARQQSSLRSREFTWSV